MSWHCLQESNSDTIIRAAPMLDRVHGEVVTDFVIIRHGFAYTFDHIILTDSGDELLNKEVEMDYWQRFERTKSVADRIIAEEETALGCDLYGFEKERKSILSALRRRNRPHLPEHPIPRSADYPQEAIDHIYRCLSTRRTDFIIDVANFAGFPYWYDDVTTFHPAFQYIYDLAAGESDGLTHGQIDNNLTRVLTSLFSCLVA